MSKLSPHKSEEVIRKLRAILRQVGITPEEWNKL